MYVLSKPQLMLFELPSVARRRSSEIIMTLSNNDTDEFVNLRGMLIQFGDRSFGLMLIVVAAFSIIPFVSIVTGLIASIIGVQLILGMKKIVLPNFILDWNLSTQKVNKAIKLFAPKVEYLEKYIKPRWHFTEAPIVDRINGIVIVILGVISAIPLPLTNVAPAILIMIMGLGLIERDGIVQVVTFVGSLVALTMFSIFVFI